MKVPYPKAKLWRSVPWEPTLAAQKRGGSPSGSCCTMSAPFRTSHRSRASSFERMADCTGRRGSSFTIRNVLLFSLSEPVSEAGASLSGPNADVWLSTNSLASANMLSIALPALRSHTWFMVWAEYWVCQEGIRERKNSEERTVVRSKGYCPPQHKQQHLARISLKILWGNIPR